MLTAHVSKTRPLSLAENLPSLPPVLQIKFAYNPCAQSWFFSCGMLGQLLQFLGQELTPERPTLGILWIAMPIRLSDWKRLTKQG